MTIMRTHKDEPMTTNTPEHNREMQRPMVLLRPRPLASLYPAAGGRPEPKSEPVRRALPRLAAAVEASRLHPIFGEAEAHNEEETVPSVEDRFGKALEGFEWFDLAGLGDKDGNDDPGLADCAVLVSLKVLEEWDETGPEANIPWSVPDEDGGRHRGKGWDLCCTVCEILDAMGQPDRTQAAIIELVRDTKVVTARTINHERPTS